MSVHTTNNGFPSRQTPRLQNTSKPSVSNGSGWAFGLPGNTSNVGGGLSSAIGGSGFSGVNRPAQLSGFAQVMGGGSSNSIDMSDFPSLSRGPQTPSNASQSTWNGGILRQQPQRTTQNTRVPSTAPSQQSADQTRSSPEPKETGDDFPPLGGQLNGDVFTTTHRSPEGSGPRTALPFRDQYGQSVQMSNGQVSNKSSTQVATPRSAGSSKRYADMTEAEKYGLEGLAAAYEARKAVESGQPVDETLPSVMRSGLFFGQDLNALGMDLDSPEPIWPTFTAFPASTSQAQAAGVANGVFDFHDRAIVPEFALPQAYTVTNVPPLASRLGSLSDETLFCIFYQNPRDVLQEQAAQELTARDWRWHKVLRQWLQKDTQHSAAASTPGGGSNSSLPILDLTNGAPVGVPPQRVSPGVERGIYVFFDVMNWRRERREFVLAYDELDQRFDPGMGMAAAAAAGTTSTAVMNGIAAGRDGMTVAN